MKKLYRKGTVHPSPPIILDHLSFLPATILALTAALSPEDREVLAYLISCSSSTSINNVFSINHRKGSSASSSQKPTFYTKNYNKSSSINDHPPMFKCDCFRCYMSYWIRWDSSPNRQLIHEIIDAFEDWLLKKGKSTTSGSNRNSRRDRKRKGNSSNESRNDELLKRSELTLKEKQDETDDLSVGGSSSGGCEGGGGGEDQEGAEEGSVRRFVSFLGERIWGVLG